MPQLPQPRDHEIRRALAEYPWLEGPVVSSLSGGLINRTFAVDDPSGSYVLQRVNPIFDPRIHDSMALVCDRLQRRGMVAPRLLLSRAGARWIEPTPGEVWRLMTRVPGCSFAVPDGPGQARAAGDLVGRFHAALASLDPGQFHGVRVGVHDTPAHRRTLARALAEHLDHPLYDSVRALAAELERALEELPAVDAVPLRIAHGDLKFSNILFASPAGPGRERAICLVDLDTLGPMPLHHELGDAWRSWCNRAGESGESESMSDVRFDVEIFRASLTGYLGSAPAPSDAERRALVCSVEWISLELATRFAADALRESYFLWDASRYARAGDHNLERARRQLALARSARSSRAARAAALGVSEP